MERSQSFDAILEDPHNGASAVSESSEPVDSGAGISSGRTDGIGACRFVVGYNHVGNTNDNSCSDSTDPATVKPKLTTVDRSVAAGRLKLRSFGGKGRRSSDITTVSSFRLDRAELLQARQQGRMEISESDVEGYLRSHPLFLSKVIAEGTPTGDSSGAGEQVTAGVVGRDSSQLSEKEAILQSLEKAAERPVSEGAHSLSADRSTGSSFREDTEQRCGTSFTEESKREDCISNASTSSGLGASINTESGNWDDPSFNSLRPPPGVSRTRPTTPVVLRRAGDIRSGSIGSQYLSSSSGKERAFRGEFRRRSGASSLGLSHDSLRELELGSEALNEPGGLVGPSRSDQPDIHHLFRTYATGHRRRSSAIMSVNKKQLVVPGDGERVRAVSTVTSYVGAKASRETSDKIGAIVANSEEVDDGSGESASEVQGVITEAKTGESTGCLPNHMGKANTSEGEKACCTCGLEVPRTTPGGALKSRRHSPSPQGRNASPAIQNDSLFLELIVDIQHELDVDLLCFKILYNISRLTNCDRGSLFLVKTVRGRKVLTSKLFDVTVHSTFEEVVHDDTSCIVIPFGKGILGHVAETKQFVNISNAYQDSRFNEEIDQKTGYKTHSILCMPVCDVEKNVVAAVQIINKRNAHSPADHQFTKQDILTFQKYLGFCGIGITNAQLFQLSLYEYKCNQLLLSLAQSLFAEQTNVEDLIMKIMTHGLDLIKCETCHVFLFDRGEALKLKKECVFSGGKVRSRSFDTGTEMDEGGVCYQVACHTARTSHTFIGNEAADFTAIDVDLHADVDEGETIRNVLCTPIKDKHGTIIGAAVMLNKTGSTFDDKDASLFEGFSIFCGLGIHNTQMFERICRLNAQQAVAFDVLSYHATAHDEETAKFMALPLPERDVFGVHTMAFHDLDMSDDDTLLAAEQMFTDIILQNRFNISRELLCRWLCSVKKNYRPVKYHNWRHAFIVTQTMYWIVTRPEMLSLFTGVEKLALLVACLCHDLDHRGTNNAFQLKSESVLATLYSTSTMEQHHFNQCVMILSNESTNILHALPPPQYQRAMDTIRHTIISSDLALFFQKKKIYADLCSSSPDWSTIEKKDLLIGMMMTACDVSASTKPWRVQSSVANLVADEFFEQGDLEKIKLNTQPVAMMDRSRRDELPQMQVDFFENVCLPVYKMLMQMFPSLEPLHIACSENRDHWKSLSESPSVPSGNS